jgi:hypothetical protein
MALSMALSVALYRRRINTMVAEGIGLVVVASETRIDLAIQFLLDEPTAAGSRFEFSCKAQVLGSPYLESPNAFDVDAGGTADVLDIGKAFQSLK